MARKSNIVRLSGSKKRPVWSGNVLSQKYKKFSDEGRIGESWETSLTEAAAVYGDTQTVFGEYLASVVAKKSFPLVKLIDAGRSLSLQLHPDEITAAKLGDRPKNEFWYVLCAEEGAQIIYGTKDGIGEDEIRKKIKDGTVLDVCEKVKVSAGDCFMIPSGMLHALGAGITVIEIQDNEGDTYRVLDLSGGGREVHTEKSCRAVRAMTKANADKLCRTENPPCLPGNILASRDGFAVSLKKCAAGERLALPLSCVYAFCAEGSVTANGETVIAGESVFFPDENTELVSDEESTVIFVR